MHKFYTKVLGSACNLEINLLTFPMQFRALLVCLLLIVNIRVVLSDPPKFNYHCIANGVPVEETNAKTGKSEKIEYWIISCKVTKDGNVVWNRSLPTQRSYDDAMEVIKDFRVTKLQQIIKEAQ